MEKGFWKNLVKPIIALAPMDGVTDAAFRLITAKYGKPALTFTEFTSAEGICAGATKTLVAFKYDESERPVVAQLFGSTPEAFYKASFVVAELGFDGIDINMGCPAKNVASRGSGASLILNPELAKEIIRATKRAATEFEAGKTIEDVGLPETIVEYVQQNRAKKFPARFLPVSVKTRIGYSEIVIEEWVKHLLETEPVNISIHGRTLKQMYTGAANWEAIGKAAKIIHQTETTILGNGDIKTMGEAYERIAQYEVDGVLIGRATFGNPWIFQNKTDATVEEKFMIALQHTHKHAEIFGTNLFPPLKKHLSWYCRGFANASEIRQKLMLAQNYEEVEEILKNGA